MRCPSCEHGNRAERRFSAECGTALAVLCPAYGVANEPGEKFCGGCGASLKIVTPGTAPSTPPASRAPLIAATPRHLADRILEARGALQGERKQVTVLFADVQGSMGLTEQLEPEEWSRIMQRFFTILADGIHARTGGNPLFIEEVVQGLIESGHLASTPGAYCLTRPVARLDVPPSVQALLAARIDRLPEGEKRVLQTAAVIGKEFTEPILRQVLAATGRAGLSDGDLDTALATLETREFLYETSLFPVAAYALKHPLTQEVALASQLQDRRRRVHAAVADAIATAHAGKLDEQAALLAHHHAVAGEHLVASEWHSRAAVFIDQGRLRRAARERRLRAVHLRRRRRDREHGRRRGRHLRHEAVLEGDHHRLRLHQPHDVEQRCQDRQA